MSQNYILRKFKRDVQFFEDKMNQQLSIAVGNLAILTNGICTDYNHLIENETYKNVVE